MGEIAIGDLVSYNKEYGIICATDPLVMKCTSFHSYVPILGVFDVIQKKHDVTCTIRDEVLQRIRNYVISLDAPTGT